MSEGGSPERAAISAAFALLSGRDFAEAELARRLAKKGHGEPAVRAAVERCRELGYLDDAAYARGRARTRLERKPSGLRAIVQDLRRQGVARTMSEQIAEEVLEEAGGERAVVERALRAWIERKGEPTDWRSARRCSDHLARRGFSSAAVGDALSDWLDELSRI